MGTKYCKVGKSVHQGVYILPPYLVNLHTEYIVRNDALEIGIIITGENINNFRLMA